MSERFKNPFDYPQRAQPINKFEIKYTRPYIATKNISNDLINKLLGLAKENDITGISNFLMEYKLPIEVRNTDGDTLLHMILKKYPEENDEKIKLTIIENIPNIKSLATVPNDTGVTPLHLAAMYQYSDVIKSLCTILRSESDSQKINVSPLDIFGMTPLHYATIGYLYHCESFKKRQNKIALTDDELKIREMIRKEMGERAEPIPRRLDVVKESIKYDANNTTMDNEKKCIKTSVDVIKMLLNLGASINAQDNHKMTPLFYALRNNDYTLIELFLKTDGVSTHFPNNSHGDNPLEYYKKIYSTHLMAFSDSQNPIQKIDAFAQPHMQKLKDFLNATQKYTIINIDDLPRRVFVMLIEELKNISEHNFPNALNTINQVYDIHEIIPVPPNTYEYPFLTIYSESKIAHPIVTIPKYIINMYTEIRWNVDNQSLYNSYWKKYINMLNHKETNPFTFRLSELQDMIIRGKMEPNVKTILDNLSILYGKINTKIIEKYNDSQNSLDNNEILLLIAYIIAHNLGSIVCYDMYRKMLYVIAEQTKKYVDNLQTSFDEKTDEHAKAVATFNKENEQQRKYDTMIQNDQRKLLSLRKQLQKITPKPLDMDFINALDELEQIYRMTVTYISNISKIVEKLSGKKMYNDSLNMTLTYIADNTRNIGLLNTAIKFFAQKLTTIYTEREMATTADVRLATNVELKLISRLKKFVDNLNKLEKQIDDLMRSANEISAIPLEKLPIPPRPLPTGIPVLPTVAPQDKKDELTLNYVKIIKDDIMVSINATMPYAIVNNLLDKTSTIWAIDNVAAQNLDELFDVQFVALLEKAHYPNDAVKKMIIDSIKLEIFPIYKKVCDLSVSGLKSMIDKYMSYIAIESQFIKIYNIMHDHK